MTKRKNGKNYDRMRTSLSGSRFLKEVLTRIETEFCSDEHKQIVLPSPVCHGYDSYHYYDSFSIVSIDGHKWFMSVGKLKDRHRFPHRIVSDILAVPADDIADNIKDYLSEFRYRVSVLGYPGFRYSMLCIQPSGLLTSGEETIFGYSALRKAHELAGGLPRSDNQKDVRYYPKNIEPIAQAIITTLKEYSYF